MDEHDRASFLWHRVAPVGLGVQTDGWYAPVVVRSIAIGRFENDRVVENWNVQDQFVLLQQVGFLGDDITGAQVPDSRIEQGAVP